MRCSRLNTTNVDFYLNKRRESFFKREFEFHVLLQLYRLIYYTLERTASLGVEFELPANDHQRNIQEVGQS